MYHKFTKLNGPSDCFSKYVRISVLKKWWDWRSMWLAPLNSTPKLNFFFWRARKIVSSLSLVVLCFLEGGSASGKWFFKLHVRGGHRSTFQVQSAAGPVNSNRLPPIQFYFESTWSMRFSMFQVDLWQSIVVGKISYKNSNFMKALLLGWYCHCYPWCWLKDKTTVAVHSIAFRWKSGGFFCRPWKVWCRAAAEEQCLGIPHENWRQHLR